MANCQNCSSALTFGDRFCGECGSLVVYETVAAKVSTPDIADTAQKTSKLGSLLVSLAVPFAIFAITLLTADRVWFYSTGDTSFLILYDFVYVSYGIVVVVAAITAMLLGLIISRLIELHGTLLISSIAGIAGAVYVAVHLNTDGGLWSNILFLAQDPEKLGLVLGDVLTYALACTVVLSVLRSLYSK